jgi:hypothetical protein
MEESVTRIGYLLLKPCSQHIIPIATDQVMSWISEESDKFLRGTEAGN